MIGDSGYGNVIVDNGGAGVAVLSGAGTLVGDNQIDGNGKLGIDLRGDGPTANDPFDADNLDALGHVLPNRLQNAPEITDAVTTAGVTTITARFHGRPNTAVWGELFRSPSCDSERAWRGRATSGRGELHHGRGGQHVGFAGAAVPSLPDGTVLTATVTADDGTSEFSPCARTHAAPTPAAGAAPVTPGPATPAGDATSPRITRLKLRPSTFAARS